MNGERPSANQNGNEAASAWDSLTHDRINKIYKMTF